MKKMFNAAVIFALSLFFFLSMVNRITVYGGTAEGLEAGKGNVDIELKEYTLDRQGKEIPWEDIRYAMPGQEIVKIPRVTNLGKECSIRAKIQIRMDRETVNPVTADMLEGMPAGWKRKEDGYYYYDTKLKKGESVDLFRSFTIPENWETRYDEKGSIIPYYTENGIDLIVTVEAVGEEDWDGIKKMVSDVKTDDTQKPFFYLACALSALFFLYFAGNVRSGVKDEADFV